MKKGIFRKVWNFLWHSNSIWSWIVNLILAFVIVKFLLLPGLGLILDSQYPVVVVMSGSMEHDQKFDEWWSLNWAAYEKLGITKDNFTNFDYDAGFNQGDMMFVTGEDNYSVGEVIVFQGTASSPIIHRIVSIADGKYTTMGDHNQGHSRSDEINITSDRIFGKASLRVPYVGWVKLGIMKLVGAA